MDEEKIDLIELEVRQTVARRTLEILRPQIARPDLGRDEHLAARHAGGPQAIANVALVAIHRSGVDVAIAKLEGLLDHSRAGFPAQVPGAEPDQRNAGAVGFNGLHGGDNAGPASRCQPSGLLAP